MTDSTQINKKVPTGSVAYVRYLDHVLYRNTPKHANKAVEREAIGWLIDESDEVLCIGNDRTLDELPYSSGSGSGLVLLKSCIREIRVPPLQNASGWSLIYRSPNIKDAESALQTTERKIQPK